MGRGCATHRSKALASARLKVQKKTLFETEPQIPVLLAGRCATATRALHLRAVPRLSLVRRASAIHLWPPVQIKAEEEQKARIKEVAYVDRHDDYWYSAPCYCDP